MASLLTSRDERKKSAMSFLADLARCATRPKVLLPLHIIDIYTLTTALIKHYRHIRKEVRRKEHERHHSIKLLGCQFSSICLSFFFKHKIAEALTICTCTYGRIGLYERAFTSICTIHDDYASIIQCNPRKGPLKLTIKQVFTSSHKIYSLLMMMLVTYLFPYKIQMQAMQSASRSIHNVLFHGLQLCSFALCFKVLDLFL